MTEQQVVVAPGTWLKAFAKEGLNFYEVTP